MPGSSSSEPVRLHAATGELPRAPTPKLRPLRAVLDSFDELGADGGGGGSSGLASSDSLAGGAFTAAASLPSAQAIDEVANNHRAIILFTKAERRLDRGEYPAALSGFKAALVAGYPDMAACHAQCGGCLEELGRWSECAGEFSRAIEL